LSRPFLIPSLISLIEILAFLVIVSFIFFNNASAKTIDVVVPSPASATVFADACLTN
jgi:hypothetical protein